MSLILPEKQMYTVLNLKDVFFNLSLAKVSQPTFEFQWREPVGGYSGQYTWTRFSPDLKTLNTDFLPFQQRFPMRIYYKRATEGLLKELKTSGYKMSAKKSNFYRRLPIYATS